MCIYCGRDTGHTRTCGVPGQIRFDRAAKRAVREGKMAVTTSCSKCGELYGRQRSAMCPKGVSQLHDWVNKDICSHNKPACGMCAQELADLRQRLEKAEEVIGHYAKPRTWEFNRDCGSGYHRDESKKRIKYAFDRNGHDKAQEYLKEFALEAK